MTKSIIETIFKHGKDNPKKIAVVEGNLSINYADLSKKIYACKLFLEAIGIKKNDVVIISSNKSLNFIYCYFGVQLAKGIVVPVDENIPQSILKNIEKTTKSKFIFNNKNSNKLLVLNNISSNIEQYLKNDYYKKCINDPFKNQISEILFTSGTTGIPKGVILTHSNHIASAKNINKFIGNCSEDIEILPMPLNHSFGLGRLRCVLYAGGTIILINGILKIKQFFNTIELYKVTGIGLVPSAWNILDRISNDLIKKFSNQIKYIELGSAPMSIQSKRILMKLLPKTKICMHYGLTEASRSTFIEFHSEKLMLNTNGKTSPDIKITIRNSCGMILNNNIKGEVCIEGNTVMRRYFKNSLLTKNK